MIVAIWIVGYFIAGIALTGGLMKIPFREFRELERVDRSFMVVLWPLIAFVVLFFTAMDALGRFVERVWR